MSTEIFTLSSTPDFDNALPVDHVYVSKERLGLLFPYTEIESDMLYEAYVQLGGGSGGSFINIFIGTSPDYHAVLNDETALMNPILIEGNTGDTISIISDCYSGGRSVQDVLSIAETDKKNNTTTTSEVTTIPPAVSTDDVTTTPPADLPLDVTTTTTSTTITTTSPPVDVSPSSQPAVVTSPTTTIPTTSTTSRESCAGLQFLGYCYDSSKCNCQHAVCVQYLLGDCTNGACDKVHLEKGEGRKKWMVKNELIINYYLDCMLKSSQPSQPTASTVLPTRSRSEPDLHNITTLATSTDDTTTTTTTSTTTTPTANQPSTTAIRTPSSAHCEAIKLQGGCSDVNCPANHEVCLPHLFDDCSNVTLCTKIHFGSGPQRETWMIQNEERVNDYLDEKVGPVATPPQRPPQRRVLPACLQIDRRSSEPIITPEITTSDPLITITPEEALAASLGIKPGDGCSICMDELVYPGIQLHDLSQPFRCNHYMHQTCARSLFINNHAVGNGNCPTCRARPK